MKRFYLFSLVLVILSFTQIQGANWTYHLSNIHTTSVVKGGDNIYFLSDGGIFYYNQQDNSLNSLNKIDGLSGSDFKGMEYSNETQSLVVYYKNSIIDIVQIDGAVKVSPILDIYQKNISGNKQINNATCYQDLCYLACGFGIVVLDMVKMEIKDSFIIGDNGKNQVVYDVALDDNYIYAGTESGIKYAPLDAQNLLDYSYWHYVENSSVGDIGYQILQYGADRIWAVHQTDQWHGEKIISRRSETVWSREFNELKEIYSMSILGDQLIFAGENSPMEKVVYLYDKTQGLIGAIKAYPFQNESLRISPQSAIIDDAGVIWIADENYGAIQYKNGIFTQMTPEGPLDNGTFAMTYANNKLWMCSGGRHSGWSNMGNMAIFQSYTPGENEWETFYQYNHSELSKYKDIIQVLPMPGFPNHIYVASWGNGILEYNDGNLVRIYNDASTDAPLENVSGTKAGEYVRIGGMVFDDQGNLWVTNSEVTHKLHMKKADGSGWKSFTFDELSGNQNIGKVIATSNNQLWVIIPRGKTNGLYVMSTDGTKQKSLNITSYFSNGTDELFTTMNDVYDIAEDKDGKIWVGTSEGATVYSNPENVFSEDPYYASQPGLDKDDGIYHPLLQTETITAIAIDGANQKWFGTKSSGLYLISADGTEEIEHYTTTSKNAYLISDVIQSLAYNGDDGKLYIGTDLGMISIQTTSKNANDHFENVYAYPNPVKETYTGKIYITGMMEDTNVKITTISGRLVFETTSLGGQAEWNGNDLAGNRVHTGIYLVFCASSDGMESVVTKIAFIR